MHTVRGAGYMLRAVSRLRTEPLSALSRPATGSSQPRPSDWRCFTGAVRRSVLALLALFYWSADRALERQTSEAIEAEIQALNERYRIAEITGLTAAITERASRPRVSDMLYILATSGGVPLAGNMTAWPKDVRRLDGWLLFPIERHWQTGEVERSEARARSFELPQGLLLLVAAG